MIVTVDALFSYSSKIGAKIIAHGTKHMAKNQPLTSHVALLVNKRWVHESTGHSGVTVLSYEKWSKLHSEVARVPLKSTEYQIIANKFRQMVGKKYDYLGVFYLAFRIFLSYFGATLPAKNKLESTKKYFCCEVLGALTGQYYGMKSPVQILQDLLQRKANG
jgi:hypothetical protein